MRSIRRFLLFTLLSTLTVVMISAALWTYYNAVKEINSIFDANLIEASHIMQNTAIARDLPFDDDLSDLQVVFSATQDYLPPKIWDEIYEDDTHRYDARRVFQIWSDEGVLLARSEGAPTFPLANDTAGFADSNMGAYTWRVYTLQDPENAMRYQVAHRADVRSLIAKDIAWSSVLPYVFIFPLFILVIGLSIRWAFKPLQKIIAEVNQRELNHLNPLNTDKVPQEIKPLMLEMNALLDRLAQAYQREKRFTADAAHELRTPVAALKTHAQNALHTKNAQETKTILDKLITGADRCSRIISQLLTLSKLRPDEPLQDVQLVDITHMARDMVADLAPQAIKKSIEIALDASDDAAPVMGNATLLQVLMRNLIDNAIRYTPEQGQVTVQVQVDTAQKQVAFTVTDNGPGVPEALRQRIFDRFYRQLGTQASGSGLGLSIVQQIASLHQASIQADQPAQHPGLQICVRFLRA